MQALLQLRQGRAQPQWNWTSNRSRRALWCTRVDSGLHGVVWNRAGPGHQCQHRARLISDAVPTWRSSLCIRHLSTPVTSHNSLSHASVMTWCLRRQRHNHSLAVPCTSAIRSATGFESSRSSSSSSSSFSAAAPDKDKGQADAVVGKLSSDTIVGERSAVSHTTDAQTRAATPATTGTLSGRSAMVKEEGGWVEASSESIKVRKDTSGSPQSVNSVVEPRFNVSEDKSKPDEVTTNVWANTPYSSSNIQSNPSNNNQAPSDRPASKLRRYPLRRERSMWSRAREKLNPYWRGLKTLWGNVRLAASLVWDVYVGRNKSKLNRRERKIVRTTVWDMLVMLPFAAAIAAPGGSLLLPVVAKYFPNAMPSTFQMPSQETLARLRQDPNSVRMASTINTCGSFLACCGGIRIENTFLVLCWLYMQVVYHIFSIDY
jgi:hypothetical protein